jgi:hypothetical protein
LVPSPNRGDNFVWVRRPRERLRVGIGFGDETIDGGLEVDDGSEDPVAGGAG